MLGKLVKVKHKRWQEEIFLVFRIDERLPPLSNQLWVLGGKSGQLVLDFGDVEVISETG